MRLCRMTMCSLSQNFTQNTRIKSSWAGQSWILFSRLAAFFFQEIEFEPAQLVFMSEKSSCEPAQTRILSHVKTHRNCLLCAETPTKHPENSMLGRKSGLALPGSGNTKSPIHSPIRATPCQWSNPVGARQLRAKVLCHRAPLDRGWWRVARSCSGDPSLATRPNATSRMQKSPVREVFFAHETWELTATAWNSVLSLDYHTLSFLAQASCVPWNRVESFSILTGYLAKVRPNFLGPGFRASVEISISSSWTLDDNTLQPKKIAQNFMLKSRFGTFSHHKIEHVSWRYL